LAPWSSPAVSLSTSNASISTPSQLLLWLLDLFRGDHLVLAITPSTTCSTVPTGAAIRIKMRFMRRLVSLFTLHALWPFLWIWAMLYRPDRGWGFAHGSASESNVSSQMDDLLRRVEQLERQVERADLPAKPELIETRAKRAELPASTEPLARAPNAELADGTSAVATYAATASRCSRSSAFPSTNGRCRPRCSAVSS
jgi:hypothetical protein